MDPKTSIARVGDWIEVHGHVQGQPPHRALVLEVLGTAGNEHYRVRWDDEHESIFFPGPDARVIRKRKRARAGASAAGRGARAQG